MKKLLVMFILLLFCTSCNTNKASFNEHDQSTNSETIITKEVVSTEAVTIEPTQVTSVETYDSDYLLNDNIQMIDLSIPENSKYLKYMKKFTYKNEYSLPDGRKIVEDKNLYLEDSSGNREPLIEVPEEETEKYVVFWDMIDEDRFGYYIINHETIGGSGIYNIETGEDFRIDVCKDHSAYVPKIIVDNYLYFTRSFITTFKGFGILNLDTYEFTEIDCTPLLNNVNDLGGLGNLIGAGISPDGTKAAIYGIVSKASKPNELNEYQVAIYSLTEEKILETYNFFSENDYINHQLVYYNENQVYLYASQYGNNPKDFLYIININ